MCEQVPVAVSFAKRMGVRVEQMPADVTGKVFKSYECQNLSSFAGYFRANNIFKRPSSWHWCFCPVLDLKYCGFYKHFRLIWAQLPSQF